MPLSSSREQKFRNVIAHSQLDLTILLENVHDPHNIGAVLRSCDAAGIREIYVLNTDPRISMENLYAGKSSSSGAGKWVDIHYHEDPENCIRELKKKYKRILASCLSDDSESIFELKLVRSVALAFGNEHEGVSRGLLEKTDGLFKIPLYGMVQSLNVSVACAISVFEAIRQRNEANKTNRSYDPANAEHKKLFSKFLKKQQFK